MQRFISAWVLMAFLISIPAVAQEKPQSGVASVSSANTSAMVLSAKPPKSGVALAYDLSIEGTVTITQPAPTQKPDIQRQDIQVAAGLELRWQAKQTDGSYPAKLNLVAPRIKAGGKDIAPDEDATAALTAKFDGNTQILSAQTPGVLRGLGLDLTHALLGLTIPMPGGSAGVGTSWVVRSTIGSGKDYDLRTTYTLVAFEERRGKALANVRGSMVLTPRDGLSRLNYVGYLEAYVDPSTGRIVESGTSIDISGKITLPNPKSGTPDEATVRVVTTTYLLDLGPASDKLPAVPTVPTKTAPPKTTPPPVASVGQQVAPVASQSSDAVEQSKELPPNVSATQPAIPSARANGLTEPSQVGTVGTPGQAGQASTAGPASQASDVTTAQAASDPTNKVWQQGNFYNDPAGRFTLALPVGWSRTYQRISADTTAFAGPTSPQMLYVFVGPSNGENLIDFARSVLSKYAKASQQFRMLSDFVTTQVAGAPSYAVHYAYPGLTPGSIVNELSIFTRQEQQNYIVQYTDASKQFADYKDALDYLHNALQFGVTPSGVVPATSLLSGSWRTYTDALQRFTVEAPELWPLFSNSNDGVNTTFAELGKKGYLTIYTQKQMGNYSADTVLAAWREQWARQEKGYTEIIGLSPILLGQMPGAELSYEWVNADGRTWRRHLQAAVHQETLYVITLDYVASYAPERNSVLTRVFSSFQFLTALTAPVMPEIVTLPSVVEQNTVALPMRAGGVVSGPGHASQASQLRVEDPLDGNRTLLTGRMGVRQGLDIRWLSGVTLRIRAGQSLYATRTDTGGYFVFPNIAPLSHGSYELVDIDGTVPGYREPITITFTEVILPTGVGKYLNTGRVLLEPQIGGAIDVVCVQPQSLPDPHEAARQILSTHPQTGWGAVLKTALTNR